MKDTLDTFRRVGARLRRALRSTSPRCVALAPGSAAIGPTWTLRADVDGVNVSGGPDELEIHCGAAGGAVLTQDVTDAHARRSEDYRLEVEARGAEPGSVWLSVDDGVTDHRWTEPSSGGDWERLRLEGIVSHRATRLRLCIHIAPDTSVRVRAPRFHAERVPALANPTLADLTETIPDEHRPRLDRTELDETELTERQSFWRENGFLILPRFLPDDRVDAYCRVREKLDAPGGWPTVNPYHQVPEIKELCLHRPLMAVLEELIGEPMGMHLNLTGWVSTERNWHQDDYLNPPSVRNHYAAVWFALDDISPDAGPFEYIPGSHRWPALRRDRVLRYVSPEERTGEWPKTSERFVVPLLEQEIARRGVESRRFLASKGDVLIWNGHLVHRGTAPRDPSLLRKAIITHYSSIHRRLDAPEPTLFRDEGWFF